VSPVWRTTRSTSARRSARRSTLSEAGEAGADEPREEAYSDHSAGYDSADEWWAFVADHLASLPGVERRESGDSSSSGGDA